MCTTWKTASDTKISNFVSYEPMLRGDYLYFYTPGNGENMQFMCRVDMYSGKVDKAEGAAIVYDYYVTPKYIAAAKGGFVKIKFSEWDTFSNTSSAGTKAYPALQQWKDLDRKMPTVKRIWIRKYLAQRKERA